MMGRSVVGPYLLRINPMSATCNHVCPMCYLQQMDPTDLKAYQQAEHGDGLRLADYVALFDSMPPGLQEVNIVGGGEPLIHPDAGALMGAVKRHGWKGILITNGTLLREPVARQMAAMGWDLTRVSVHAGDRKTYHKIHGVDRFEILRENLKTFDRLRRGPDAVKQDGTPRCELAIFHVLQHENIATIDRLFALAEEVGADSLVFEKVIAHNDDMRLTAEELHQACEQIESCARTSRVPCNLDEVLPQLVKEESCTREQKPFRPGGRCSVGYDQVYLTSTGDVLPCCFSNELMGNVRQQSFGEIWHGTKYHDFRKRLMDGRFAPYCYAAHCSMPGVLHD